MKEFKFVVRNLYIKHKRRKKKAKRLKNGEKSSKADKTTDIKKTER